MTPLGTHDISAKHAVIPGFPEKLSGSMRTVFFKLASYFKLIKSWQTGLLLVSGLAGFLSSPNPDSGWQTVAGLLGSLFLAISGSTVLNMVYDRDIDARMVRTMQRPIPSGKVSVKEGLALGIILATGGIIWAVFLSPLYAAIVTGGLFFNGIVYTVWLKRKTPWSILWGGIAGGMPVMAGRVLSIGQIDATGLLLMAAVVLWIPTHIMTFSMRYSQDYSSAGVPVFPNSYSKRTVNLIIGVSTCLAAAAFLTAAYLIGLQAIYWYLMAGLGGILFILTVLSSATNSSSVNFLLFKAASVYMLIALLLIMVGL
ncbi:MAG: protoheme IX farnesyltransferase [Dehalococcoidales bacterium]|jgi:protoheme IX farnesyltransferase|nr:protoheme IX farnesyltransferase [Dehalococcoidales bacterium]MDD4230597.1 protoheme IX farnesyltransferase [Dehalococcoidales bacterium]MDD4465490.1 protoheme IX farnesyltransferase [Dehalococcoidales bacterium]